MPTRILPLLVAAGLTGCALFRPDPPSYDAVTEESGLVRRDLVIPDEGEAVAEGDAVAVHYELRLADRTLVESSEGTGQPLRFTVGDGTVPQGLDRGVVGMRLFGRRRLSVPSALAFGSEGRPPRIPPDTDVTFVVEVMEHVPK